MMAVAGSLLVLGAACGSTDQAAAARRAEIEQQLQELRQANQELQALRAENQELPRLRRENEELKRLTAQIEELDQLRKENAELRARLESLRPGQARR